MPRRSRQVNVVAPIPEVTHTLRISEATYYLWRKQYGQMAVVSEIRRLRQREDENGKLKQLVADLTLDKVILQEVLAEKEGHTQTRAGPYRHRSISNRRAVGVWAAPVESSHVVLSLPWAGRYRDSRADAEIAQASRV